MKLLCVDRVCKLNCVIVFDYDIIWVVECGFKLIVSYYICFESFYVYLLNVIWFFFLILLIN